MTATELRQQATAIWTAAVDAVRPEPLVISTIQNFPTVWVAALEAAPCIRVVGCGKAGAAMVTGLETALQPLLDRVVGLVNVPAGSVRPTSRIRLHPARPDGSNHPTAEGVQGANDMLALLREAGPDDVAICLISGGGSALLPAPIESISLEDKQRITKLLHACGATITEMNAVRKHLSRVKGGRLAEAFRGKLLISLIISDVVGDPLDVIASGPTVPDPSTFADAWNVLCKFELLDKTPVAVREHLAAGATGKIADTPKMLPPNVVNRLIGTNAVAMASAAVMAHAFGYTVLSHGTACDGDTTDVANHIASQVQQMREHSPQLMTPLCILIGGETTVKLGDNPGLGGRNQEFVLAMLTRLGEVGMHNVCVLSGGTDGEDGPTDAAGAVATSDTWPEARKQGLDPAAYLTAHDSYHFFQKVDGLLQTGLTNTNVMDVRVVLLR